MKALVIAPQPFFSPRGTPLSVYYRTLVTAELGVEVDLLTYGQGQDVDIPGVRVLRLPRMGIGHVRVGPSMAKLLLDTVMFFELMWLLARNRYDFVHAHEEAVFLCVLLKPIFGFKLVYDMHSSLPQQLTSFGFTRSRFLIGAFERLELTALRSADFVITICEDLYRYADRFLENSDRHALIENSLLEPVRVLGTGGGARTGNEEEITERVVLRSVPPEALLVVYAGTLEPYQGIDLLLEGFRLVVDDSGDAFLLIAGGTPQQVEEYRGRAAELGLVDRVSFTGTVPRSVAAALNRMACVLVSTRTTGGNTPLKVYEQLVSGVPLVATDVHSHTQVLDREVAFLVQPDPEAVAEGILQAMHDEKERERKVNNARALSSASIPGGAIARSCAECSRRCADVRNRRDRRSLRPPCTGGRPPP